MQEASENEFNSTGNFNSMETVEDARRQLYREFIPHKQSLLAFWICFSLFSFILADFVFDSFSSK